ncbi:hypothetical protein U14_00804 [Candidatus Moduliflexus flocculans]|uniref:Uncharacterized protein n=1 Tax=Candidatus Moduliflexus flocculans TaxID=1499966 RepID=A0A0S6VQQ9_9BACT|nr:hypothetical protein U14_00804 [Candidatus Moduliflexus flocculans]
MNQEWSEWLNTAHSIVLAIPEQHELPIIAIWRNSTPGCFRSPFYLFMTFCVE